MNTERLYYNNDEDLLKQFLSRTLDVLQKQKEQRDIDRLIYDIEKIYAWLNQESDIIWRNP